MPITIEELHIGNQPDAEQVLCCPKCKGSFLHHEDVTVYVRPKEDGPTERVHVFPGGTTERWDGRGNPSERRGGVGIFFSCETCPHLLQLTLAQHKGETFIRWRVMTP